MEVYEKTLGILKKYGVEITLEQWKEILDAAIEVQFHDEMTQEELWALDTQLGWLQFRVRTLAVKLRKAQTEKTS